MTLPLAPRAALLIVGHGTKSEAGCAQFAELVERAQLRAAYADVAGGFLELAPPPIQDSVNRLVEAGHRTIDVVPLVLVASVAIARIAESNLVAVDPGAIEAGTAMGAKPWQVLFGIVVPEALGPLVLGLTYIFVALIDATAVAGVVGGGGLGDLAIRYGYQRFDWFVVGVIVVLLIVLVQGAQLLGNAVARRVMHA